MLENPMLREDHVDVWKAALDVNEARLVYFHQFLSRDEQTKSDHMRSKKVRDRFVASRALLRMILSMYLKEKPHALHFQVNDHGKPSLIHQEYTGITFNMSHSHGMALYAVGLKRALGVDIEKIRVNLDMEGISKRYFSPREYEDLRALPEDQKKYGFFNCWTRKEAFIKAKGTSLASSIRSLGVSLTPGESAALLEYLPDSDEIGKWSLIDLNVATDYAAALVVEGQGVELSVRQWTQGSERFLGHDSRFDETLLKGS